MALTKARIANRIQMHLNFSRKKSEVAVETLLEIMKSSLASGDDVLISGFGRFGVKQKKQRRGRNPATGEDVILRPRKIVTFKCSGKLKDKINSTEKSLTCKWAETQHC